MTRAIGVVAAVAWAISVVSAAHNQAQDSPPLAGFRFRSGVELVNVTATVTDSQGRFVPGLRAEDFVVYDNDEPVAITHFSSDRVPVSLGLILDTSGSMTPDKLASARGAIERLMDTMLGADDEMFLSHFANVSQLVQPWTNDRHLLSRALGALNAGGGTALYDAVAEALPIAQSGRNPRKAIVVISDGNDTASTITERQLKNVIREREVLAYAIGIDGDAEGPVRRHTPQPQPPPMPGRGWPPKFPPIGRRASGGSPWTPNSGERVNADALRSITDDTGGRTEIVRDSRDLSGAIARIADELTQQYSLGYTSDGTKDGRWHSIRVEVRNRNLHVRARKGYIAS
jgi:VWFA-related protein